MPAATVASPTTSTSALSSTTSTQNNAAIQSGPYTKAQFHSTMEGSRSIKNGKEIEQLLRDYPAALELYRTGKYKVKVKYESDVERVILVEKRSSKNAANNGSTSSSAPTRDISVAAAAAVEKPKPEVKKEQSSEQSRSRTQSRDRVASETSATNGSATAHTAASSKLVPTQTQNKVEQHYRRSSKEREASVTSQSKNSQPPTQKQHGHRRSQSRESASIASQTKRSGRKSHRDHARMIVPYVPNAHPAATTWNPARALQPYYSHPMLQPPQANMYMPSKFLPQPNLHYHQPYAYGQQPPPPHAYQKPATYSTAPTIKSTSNVTNTNLHATPNYSSSSRSIFNSNHAVGGRLPPTFHTFHPNQQQYQPAGPHPMYQSQVPMFWPTTAGGPLSSMPKNQEASSKHRRQSKERGSSVEQGPRSYPPANAYTPRQHHQVQPHPQTPKQVIIAPPPSQTAPAVEHLHYHRYHHHRGYPGAAVNNAPPVLTAEVMKELNVLPPQITVATASTTSTNANGERLTIRQLNDIFLQSDPTGRLPYGFLPPVLQRFGIGLTEQELTSAAQNLEYNIAEPISARRLVHVLVKLGKIAKSTNHQSQPPPAASPSMLPEDREVTAIMTKRPIASNSLNPASYLHHWH